MKAKINSIICIVLALIMSAGMVACQDVNENRDKEASIKENNGESFEFDADYSIEYGDGKYFIVFDDISTYHSEHESQEATISFSSIKEFKDSVTKGLLTDNHKSIIAGAFKKNERGDAIICDFHNLYAPKLPSQGEYRNVSWSGQSYSFSVSFTGGVNGSLWYLTNDEYEEIYQRDYQGFYDNKNITITKTETLADGKNVIYYSTDVGDFKLVRYTLSSKDKTIIVDETYRLRLNYPISPTSSTVPSSIDVYCTDQNQNCIIYLYDFTEAPTDKWLLEFGLEKYVDNGAAVK